MGHGASFAVAGRGVRLLTMISAVLTMIVAGGRCEAQGQPPEEHPGYTMHVYVNRMQIPVLVLGFSLDYVPQVDTRRLIVRLGGRESFRPTHTRVEGDDPITLAILLDVSGSQNKLLRGFGGAMAKLAASSLHPQDKVGIYALDCDLVRPSGYVAADAGTLKLAAERAVKASTPRVDKDVRPCGDSLPLLDSMEAVGDELSQQPGRRVLLVTSDGHDEGSKVDDD